MPEIEYHVFALGAEIGQVPHNPGSIEQLAVGKFIADSDRFRRKEFQRNIPARFALLPTVAEPVIKGQNGIAPLRFRRRRDPLYLTHKSVHPHGRNRRYGQ